MGKIALSVTLNSFQGRKGVKIRLSAGKFAIST